jgi:hypothetical protein
VITQGTRKIAIEERPEGDWVHVRDFVSKVDLDFLVDSAHSSEFVAALRWCVEIRVDGETSSAIERDELEG